MDSRGNFLKYICKVTYIPPITVYEKRDHQFEGEWRKVCRKLWKDEREGRDAIIKI